MKTKIRDFLFVYILNCLALHYIPDTRTGMGLVILIMLSITAFATLAIARQKDEENDAN